MKFITSNSFETPNDFMLALADVIATGPMGGSQPHNLWRAHVAAMFQPIEASDGSAQPLTEAMQQVQADLIGAHRDATNTHLAIRNLELQLAQGHLREAKRAYEELQQTNDKIEEDLAEVLCSSNDLCVSLDELEREAEKARRVIAGTTDIEDSGSLLDMLNAVLSQASLDRANLSHANEKIRELRKSVDAMLVERNELKNESYRLASEVERLREKESLHTESNGMLAQERDRAIQARDEAREAYLRINPELELGQTSWHFKANDALEFARTQLPACKKCGAKSAALEEGLCGNCAPL